MPYEAKDLYSTRHESTINALKSSDFPADGEWKPLIDDARALVITEGFNVEKYKVCETLRSKVASGSKKEIKPAATLLRAAGVISLPSVGTKVIPGNVIKRLAALETLRHLWLLKKSGSHKIWVLSLPGAYRDWPEADLAGKDYDGIGNRVNDPSSHFSSDDRKHLSDATKEGLKWVQKAMIVAADPAHKKHRALIKRWFADANTKDEDYAAIGSALNAGLKKIAAKISSTFVLFTDMPMNRGVQEKANVNAFVFSNEKVGVIYVEAAFFSSRDMFKDLKNWTRIVVHELSHREVKTDDHRYRHHTAGLKPGSGDAKFTAAMALANADSWAMFCMDCAGRMTSADYAKVKVD